MNGTRCTTHPAYEADYCPLCGTARVIGAQPTPRPLLEVLAEHVAQVQARRDLEAGVALMDPDAANHRHATDCSCAMCQLGRLDGAL